MKVGSIEHVCRCRTERWTRTLERVGERRVLANGGFNDGCFEEVGEDEKARSEARAGPLTGEG